VLVKMTNQMGMLFVLPEPLMREYIVNMLRGISEFLSSMDELSIIELIFIGNNRFGFDR
jgi:hypothetical protein